jgi:hypothetical protein
VVRDGQVVRVTWAAAIMWTSGFDAQIERRIDASMTVIMAPTRPGSAFLQISPTALIAARPCHV